MKTVKNLTLMSAIAVFAQSQAQVVLMPDSTNNRLVALSPVDGSVINSNVFGLAAGTPIHAMSVGSEIWVSEQIGDRVSRWSTAGTFLGSLGGAGVMDNVRGMGMANGTVYVTNDGTGGGAPGPALFQFDTAGTQLAVMPLAFTPGPFHVLDHQGGILVSSDTATDDVHRYSYAGASMGTFHNSTGLNFAEQMDHSLTGNILVAGFSSDLVVTLDQNTGTILGSFAASGARGVYQLSNGNVLWTNSAGAHVWDAVTGGSSLVYAGGGRFLEFSTVPEPSTMLLVGAGVALLAFHRRNR
jgi:hypothetical protein